MYSIFGFSNNVDKYLEFLEQVNAIGNGDLVEDVAGGLQYGLE
jgi:hypothetical protein